MLPVSGYREKLLAADHSRHETEHDQTPHAIVPASSVVDGVLAEGAVWEETHLLNEHETSKSLPCKYQVRHYQGGWAGR